MIGIDIGYKELRIASLKKQGGRFYLEGWHRVELPEAAIDKDGGIADTAAVAALIVAAMKEARCRERECILTFSGRGVVVQISSVPKMPLKEVDEVIRGELEAIPSLAEEGFIFDYHPLATLSKAEAGKLKIVYVGISRKMLDSYLLCAHEAGLKVLGVDISCFCFLNSVYQGLSKTQGTSGLVLIHDRAAYTMIVEQGRLALMYSSNVGLHDLMTPQGELDQEKCLRLVREFERALKVYSIEFQAQPPTNIVLSWNSRAAPQLAEILKRQMETIDVTAADMENELSGFSRTIPPEARKQYSPDYAVAIGAARRGLAKIAHEVSLYRLQEYLPKPGYVAKKVVQVGVLVAGVLCFTMAAQMFFSLSMNRFNRKIQEVNQDITVIDQKLADLHRLQNIHAQLKEKVTLQVVYMRRLTRVPWPQLLSEVTKRLPKKAWLDEFQAKESGQLVLRGMTFSLDIIADFIRNLKEFQSFSEVNLESTELLKVTSGREELSILKFGLDISLRKEESDGSTEE